MATQIEKEELTIIYSTFGILAVLWLIVIFSDSTAQGLFMLILGIGTAILITFFVRVKARNHQDAWIQNQLYRKYQEGSEEEGLDEATSDLNKKNPTL